jgi:alpha-L-fucosidase
LLKRGDPEGRYWMPAMSDAPLRGHGGHEWFWEPGDERLIHPLDRLVEMYLGSVGHNSTLILGVAPDTRGLLPEADVARLREFGARIRRMFGRPLAEAAGEGRTLELLLEEPVEFDLLVLQEEIRHGERVREYTLEVREGGAWRALAEGTCIGHKRILRVPPVTASGVRLVVQEAIARPLIRRLAIYTSRD